MLYRFISDCTLAVDELIGLQQGLYFVMLSRLAAEDMDQDITVIHNNPMADRYAVDIFRMDVLLLERLAQVIHNRPDMGLGVPAADDVINYAVALVRKTRPAPSRVSEGDNQIGELVSWGAGPRASQCLILAAKARAVLEGRYAASIEDVNAVATPVLRHRIVTNFNAEAQGIAPTDVIDRLIG